MVVLRPGLIMLQPGLNREKLPLKMQKWDILESPAMNAVDYPQEVPRELPHREAIVLI
jgi:hypothetical protein